jgi:hypothetical protein
MNNRILVQIATGTLLKKKPRPKVKVKNVVPPSEIDKRSMPNFATSMHGAYVFKCKDIFRLAKKGVFKVKLTSKNPAKWVKATFKITDPSEFETKPMTGIDKAKVRKYADFLKKDPGSIPPVLFAKDKKTGRSYFIDGNHRLIAAFLAGITEIPCYEFDLNQLMRAYYLNSKGEKKRFVKKDW